MHHPKTFGKMIHPNKLLNMSNLLLIMLIHTNIKILGGFPIEIETKISKLITCSLAIFII